ncbi:hypothetical protein BMG05_09620 [Mycobacterium malmoense]|nr:hypothetical protein BMG05_09620 [Mycobacterium malmoense]
MITGLGCVFTPGDADDGLGGLKCPGVAMHRVDGSAQNHYRKGRSSSIRDDQDVRPGIAAANRHDVLVYPLPTVPVQVRRALQRRPIDVDVDDLA